MTYQRNIAISSGPLPQQHVLDDVLPEPVIRIQVDAGDEAGDEDDRGAADQLLLIRPVDLLELGPGLLEEADAGRARTDRVAALGTRLPRLLVPLLHRRGRRTRGRGSGAGEGRLLLRAALTALLAGRARHYRVSRCRVW